MANHGAVCYGEDVFQAYYRMETMEHFARIKLVAELLGGPKVLPRMEVDKLLDSRARYGVKPRPSGTLSCPVAAEDLAAGDERITMTRSELIDLVNEPCVHAGWVSIEILKVSGAWYPPMENTDG